MFAKSYTVIICIGFSFAQAPDTLWTRTYGSIDADRCFSVQQTADGGYIIGGITESYGAGDEDFWLIKTDAKGDTLWAKIYGTDSMDHCSAIQQTFDGGYIAAGATKFCGPGIYIYLIKTDSLGDSLWTKTFVNSFSYSVRQTSDDGYIIAGSTWAGANENVYLIKTDSLGDTLWTKKYGGWERDLCRDVQETSDSGYILVGHTGSYGAGSYDIWLLKTDDNGDTLWTKTYGGTSWDYSSSVDQTTDGGYIVTGRTNSFCVGYSDLWLLRTDANGDTLWTKIYGEMGCEGGCYVQETHDGGFIIAGFTDSYGPGDKNAWILKTNSTGDTLWSRIYGGPNFDRFYGGQETSDNGYIFAGTTTSFGSGSVDIWLMKMDADTFGVKEQEIIPKKKDYPSATIFSGSLPLPIDKQFKVFDIVGRLVVPDKLKPGVYFIEIDGQIRQKVIKIR